jgi:chloride channel 7
LFFNTEGGTIRTLFKVSPYFEIKSFDLALFGITWYLFTIITYGVWIPAGLFLPGIIMGGAMGRLWAYGIQYFFGYYDKDEIEQNTILGSAAMLAGYCRLTYSLTVIMLETTQAVNLFIPMMINMLASYFTAIIFNQSLYIRALRGKQCPFLLDEIPYINKNIRAQVIMKTPHTLPLVPTVAEIEEGLKKEYRVFPLINKSG